MKREDLQSFTNLYVNIVLSSGFGLKGTIEKINDTTILFKTKQGTSTIGIEHIMSVMESER